MKKIYILFYLLIYFAKGNAQIATIFSDEYATMPTSRAGITVNTFANASSLTVDFINKFYRGGSIDLPLKDKVLARTKNSNRIGAELNTGIFGAFQLDSLFHKDGFNLFFGVQDRQHFDCFFSKDFYKVAFYGNQAYSGQIANFSDFSLNLIRYQQFQIGLFSSTVDTAARWGIALSFLNGEQYQSIYARKARLFTSEDGQYITFDTEIEKAESNPENKKSGASNGFGVSMDIYFEAPFKTKIGDAKIAVSVSDIGLINFNSKSRYSSQDSVFHYSGFHINSIFDIRDSTFFNTSQDSIQQNILPPAKRSVTVTLPSTLNLSIETKLNEYFHVIGGIHHIFNANYTLLFYTKGNIYFNKRVMMSATIGYGGYSGLSNGLNALNGGLGLGIKAGSGFSIYAGTSNIEGFIFPSQVAGRAAYFSIIKNFN